MIKKIAITGGKGGTGKSTIATAFAIALSKRYKTLLLDADVDCPNDHLILNIKRKQEKKIFQQIPKFYPKKCIKCGRCAEVCRENAIVFVKNKNPIFFTDQCIGCGACMITCPTGAIGKTKKKIGTIYSGIHQNIGFFSAETEIGTEEESPIVNGLKKFVKKEEKNYDYILFDTSPGTHCNVISALEDCDLAFSVTEPTPFGAHDLELNLKLLKLLKIPTKIVLNKSDLGNKKIIEDLAKKYRTEIIAEIPFNKQIVLDYSEGKPITAQNINKMVEFLEKEKNLLKENE